MIAATRLPRPEGPPVLLLHTTAMCETEAEAERVLAPLAACPIADRAIAHERGPTTIEAGERGPGRAEPRGPPLRRRLHLDRRPGRGSSRRCCATLWSELPTEHSFSIWYGWAPSRPLPDMAFSVEGRAYIATYAIWPDPADDERHRRLGRRTTPRGWPTLGTGVYLGDTDFTRRSDRFLVAERTSRGCRRSGPGATPTAASAPT